MSKNARFATFVIAILAILAVLFLCFGHLKHEREEELARLTGNDEQTQILRDEADAFRTANSQTQLGLVAAGLVIVLASTAWWLIQRQRQRD